MSELPKGWAEAEIGELAYYVSRGRSPKYVEKSALPVINQRCVRWHGVDETFVKFVDPATWHQWDNERLVRRSDILWNSTGTGTIGRAALFTELPSYDRAVVDSHVTIVRAGPAVDPAYLFGYIKSPAVQDKIEDMQSGSTNQVELNRSEIVSTVVPVAPLPEQRRIVAKVDGLTARTARARKELNRIPTLIARYKQRLLALAFSGELPALNPSADKAEFHAVGDIVDISSGYGFPKDRQGKATGDYPFAKVSDISRAVAENGGVLGTAINYVDDDDLKTLKAKPIGRGSIVFAKIGEALKLNRRAITTVPLILDNNCMALTPASSKVLPAYLLRFMQTIDLGPLSVATAVPSVRRGDVASLQILLPSLEEQAEIVRRIESAFGWLDRMAADHAAATRLLPKLDAAILAKAFRGELVPQDPNDEPASALLDRIKAEREAEAKKPKSGRGRKPNGSKAQGMTEKTLPPRDRLLKDSEGWPLVGLPFEAIAMRNSMPHDALRDALFELLSGPSPALQQRFDTDAEVMVIQRVAA